MVRSVVGGSASPTVTVLNRESCGAHLHRQMCYSSKAMCEVFGREDSHVGESTNPGCLRAIGGSALAGHHDDVAGQPREGAGE